MVIVFLEHLHSASLPIELPHNFHKYFLVSKKFHLNAAILIQFQNNLSNFIVILCYDQYFIMFGQKNMSFTTNKMEETTEGLYRKC